MPRQNRVTPFGTLEADAARGDFMGNRGCLHDADGVLGATRWRHANWVTCTLTSDGPPRTIMQPNCYTELFFLDEAVALAAGHRPCAQCRRNAFDTFAWAWQRAHRLERPAHAPAIDRALHAARVTRDRRQIRTMIRLSDVPCGAFVSSERRPTEAWLVWTNGLHLWSHSGYVAREKRSEVVVQLLTPVPTCAVLSAGYRPALHASVAEGRIEPNRT